MLTGILLGLLALSPQEVESVLPGGEEPVDEVTVYAEESITFLRRKLRVVDEQFFTRYNELNSNDDFDMVCKRETRLGSQIPRQVCRSKLHRERTSEAAEDARDEDIGLGDDSIAWTRQHYRKVREDIGEVLKQDAELRDIVRDRKNILEEIERKKSASRD
ncbi:MAG: hypothetical protein AAGA33_04975 [Pseudomonadota bacterium]